MKSSIMLQNDTTVATSSPTQTSPQQDAQLSSSAPKRKCIQKMKANSIETPFGGQNTSPTSTSTVKVNRILFTTVIVPLRRLDPDRDGDLCYDDDQECDDNVSVITFEDDGDDGEDSDDDSCAAHHNSEQLRAQSSTPSIDGTDRRCRRGGRRPNHRCSMPALQKAGSSRMLLPRTESSRMLLPLQRGGSSRNIMLQRADSSRNMMLNNISGHTQRSKAESSYDFCPLRPQRVDSSTATANASNNTSNNNSLNLHGSSNLSHLYGAVSATGTANGSDRHSGNTSKSMLFNSSINFNASFSCRGGDSPSMMSSLTDVAPTQPKRRESKPCEKSAAQAAASLQAVADSTHHSKTESIPEEKQPQPSKLLSLSRHNNNNKCLAGVLMPSAEDSDDSSCSSVFEADLPPTMLLYSSSHHNTTKTNIKKYNSPQIDNNNNNKFPATQALQQPQTSLLKFNEDSVRSKLKQARLHLVSSCSNLSISSSSTMSFFEDNTPAVLPICSKNKTRRC